MGNNVGDDRVRPCPNQNWSYSIQLLYPIVTIAMKAIVLNSIQLLSSSFGLDERGYFQENPLLIDSIRLTSSCQTDMKNVRVMNKAVKNGPRARDQILYSRSHIVHL